MKRSYTWRPATACYKYTNRVAIYGGGFDVFHRDLGISKPSITRLPDLPAYQTALEFVSAVNRVNEGRDYTARPRAGGPCQQGDIEHMQLANIPSPHPPTFTKRSKSSNVWLPPQRPVKRSTAGHGRNASSVVVVWRCHFGPISFQESSELTEPQCANKNLSSC